MCEARIACGKTLTNLGSPYDSGFGQDWLAFSKAEMNAAARQGKARQGNKIHFDLTEMKDINGALGNTGSYGNMPISGPNGNTTIVRTGWIVDPGSTTPRLTTLYVK